MTSDIHALVGPYAVDAVDDLERAAFERHLSECEDCAAEVAELREAGALLAATQETAPPERLREQVLAGIHSVRPLPPETPSGEREVRRTSRRFRPAALLAAAAAVIVVGAGVTVWQQVTEEETTQAPQVSPVERVLSAEDAEEYTQRSNGAEVTVVRSKSLNQAVLLAEDMPAAPEGKVYELWLDHGDGMVPAGVMTSADEPVLFEGDPATAQGAGITVEPGPDGSKAPTSPAVMLFTFERA